MTARQTETLNDQAVGLDTLPDADMLARLLDGQIAALHAVAPAIPEISKGATIMARALREGRRLFYVGAGSSALMGNADGLELAGTFGTDPAKVSLCMAGGLPQDSAMPGDTEDDTSQAECDAAAVQAGDAIIAVTASGSTPYALQFARLARLKRAHVIAIANNVDAPIFDGAAAAICLATPPELVAGSTRMGAGTAQKAALNMMSTLMGAKLGHIHDGMMINVRADNAKLRARATAMVQHIANASAEQAEAALDHTGWNAKAAILHLAGAPDPLALLDQHQGQLRPAIWAQKSKSSNQSNREST